MARSQTDVGDIIWSTCNDGVRAGACTNCTERAQSVTRRLALLCPHPYRGGMLNTLRNAAVILNGIKSNFGIDQIVLGLRTDVYPTEKLDALRATGIEVRHCDYEPVAAKFVTRFLGSELLEGDGKRYPDYVRPVDRAGGYDFLDCEAWLFWQIFAVYPLAPLKPYGAFYADAIPRVAPEPGRQTRDPGKDPFVGAIWPYYRAQMTSLRRANVVFSTTAKTLDDVISYVGVARKNTLLLPHAYVPFNGPRPSRFSRLKNPYFVWPTNTSFHKNQPRALEAIKTYLEMHDGRLDIAVIGPLSDQLLTNMFDNEHIQAFKTLYASLPPRFKKKIHLLGELSDEMVAAVFAHAEFIWQNVLYDNGTSSAMECGEFGVPTVSADYPQMRFWADTFSLEARYFNPRRPDAAAAVLKSAETERLAGTFKGRFQLPKDYEKTVQTSYQTLVSRLLTPAALQSEMKLPELIRKRLQ